MPAYEWICRGCGTYLTAKCSYEERDNCRPCDLCGEPLTRVWLTAPGIAFKGAGWTPNLSNWKSMEKERLASVAERKETLAPLHEKAWEKALNTATDWTDQDHLDHENAVKAMRRPNGTFAPTAVT